MQSDIFRLFSKEREITEDERSPSGDQFAFIMLSLLGATIHWNSTLCSNRVRAVRRCGTETVE